MKNKKKVLALILSIIMSLSLFTVASAANETADESIIISEYDAIVEYRTMDVAELQEEGLTIEEIEYLQSTAIEDELLFRQTRSSEELQNYYGYSEDEIALLMEYDGERIENAPELRALTGTLTIYTPDVLYAEADGIGIEVEWEWDQKPVYTLTDALAVYWVGTYGRDDGNLRIDIDASSHNVTYTGITSTTFDRGFEQEDLLYGIVGEFQMMYGTYDWASSGVASLYWDTVAGSADMTSVDIKFLYGHSVTFWGPSFSWPASVGVAPEVGTDEADVRVGYVDISDGWWEDN